MSLLDFYDLLFLPLGRGIRTDRSSQLVQPLLVWVAVLGTTRAARLGRWNSNRVLEDVFVV